MCKKMQRSMMVFKVLNVNESLLIRNNVELLSSIKISTIQDLFMHYDLFRYWDPHPLHCTLFKCIRSYTKNPSHGFLVSWWDVHKGFLNLDNLYNVVVHYLIIEWMIYFGNRDGFPMVTYCIGPTVNSALAIG